MKRRPRGAGPGNTGNLASVGVFLLGHFAPGSSGGQEHLSTVAARQANCGLHAAAPPPSERLLSEELSPRGLVHRVQLFRPNDVTRGPHTTSSLLWFGF